MVSVKPMNQISLFGAVVATALAPSLAQAQSKETWMLDAAGSAAQPLDGTHRAQFSTGAMGEFGLYRSLAPQLLLGARLSGGGLTEDDSTPGTRGNMALGAVGPAIRLRPLARASDPRRGTGLWVEGTGGPGIADGAVRPVLSPGVGYVFDAGDVGVGPTARYIHVFETGERLGGEDGQIGTLGIELVLFDRGTFRASDRREFEPERPMLPASRVEPRRGIDLDPDRDGLLTGRDACPNEPETVNGINDHDGCPDEKVEFIDDRLVVDERVFFDFDKAGLKPAGQRELQAIASLYERTGYDWKELRVQGHADERGSEPYNQDLSWQRAAAVRSHLISLGVPEAILEIDSYGETRPTAPGALTESQHQQNRRVEFVVTRK